MTGPVEQRKRCRSASPRPGHTAPLRSAAEAAAVSVFPLSLEVLKSFQIYVSRWKCLLVFRFCF